MVTVLVTLGIHKLLSPEQDIRRHMRQIPNGFGGRTIDTKYISPTLGELGYLFCTESGWLSRSLEQPHPFDKNFPGNIKRGKKPFLELVHIIQTHPKQTEDIILVILGYLKEIKEKNIVILVPLEDPETLSVDIIYKGLKKLINKKYEKSGGSKLPVLVIYSIMKVFCKELKRYKGCEVKELGSHLSPDSRSKSSGDIEIFRNERLFESFEVKLDREISNHLISNVVKEKIYLHNPNRYFVLSSEIFNDDEVNISKTIEEIRTQHGCEIILDDPLKLIKRYIYLITKIDVFLKILSKKIISDNELKIEHKEEWKKIYEGFDGI